MVASRNEIVIMYKNMKSVTEYKPLCEQKEVRETGDAEGTVDFMGLGSYQDYLQISI